MKTISTNKLAMSPHYETILQKYNQELSQKGKVNNSKFYREVILPLIPDYYPQSWYQFLHRLKATAGSSVAQASNQKELSPPEIQENKLQNTLLSNEKATALAINRALNIAVNRLQEIEKNPQLLSHKDAIDLFFKAMKAQDSRIHAVGKIREDSRKEDAFERAFTRNAYGE